MCRFGPIGPTTPSGMRQPSARCNLNQCGAGLRFQAAYILTGAEAQIKPRTLKATLSYTETDEVENDVSLKELITDGHIAYSKRGWRHTCLLPVSCISTYVPQSLQESRGHDGTSLRRTRCGWMAVRFLRTMHLLSPKALMRRAVRRIGMQPSAAAATAAAAAAAAAARLDLR